MTYSIQKIRPEHNHAICKIIKNVGAEFGAIGQGFGPSDPEVEMMSEYYLEQNASRYLVAIVDNQVVGGCGIAAFSGNNGICELRKLFLVAQSRGLGIGKALTEKCLAYAKSQGYKSCYLDTLKGMKSAIALYQGLGFKHLEQPLEGTIHNGCDVWMLKQL